MPLQLILTGVPNLPHVRPGDDLAELVWSGLEAAGIELGAGDVLVLAHKIVSKAEGRLVNLADVTPSPAAIALATTTEKDPRLVELILRESVAISRQRRGLLITRHRLGFTSANAGIDRSNVPQEAGQETVLLLPADPDETAVRLQQTWSARSGVPLGVVIADSHGRPFRLGTVGVAIGVAGIPALWDRRGESDMYGYRLQHTDVALADEIAAAAGLIMGQAGEQIPVVHIRGLQPSAPTGRAQDLIRPAELDLYR